MESSVINCMHWEDFEAKLTDLVHTRAQNAARSPNRHFSGFLFRGQRNSNWGLDTTLERSGFENMSLQSYYRSL